MRAKATIVVSVFLFASCSGVRSVQLQPPIPTPPGLVWGYGAEKAKGKNPELGRQSAYLKAIDDLLTRGPILVSKTVQDNTTVVNVKSSRRTMESSFRLRASRMLQPAFMDSGIDDGYVWVLIGTTEEDIERGWREFVAWRTGKIDQARTLFQKAHGPERLTTLKASLAMLEEVGAQDDPALVYYEVKTALDAELARIAELDALQRKFRALMESGQLVAADVALDRAFAIGLDPVAHNQFKRELRNRREHAGQLVAAGDELVRDEQYREARDRYEQAQRLDRDHPHLISKLELADRHHRTARSQTMRSTVTMVGWGATRALSEYFEYKKEQEARKRAEAEKAAEEARNKKRNQ